jgi:hypothetical protein
MDTIWLIALAAGVIVVGWWAWKKWGGGAV